MAGKAEALAAKLGDNMRESLGARSGGPDLNLHKPDMLASQPEDGYQKSKTSGLMALDNITPDPNQIRKAFDETELAGLATSIETYGILQPLVVQWNAELGKHVIIAGERRFRAAKLAGLEVVPCEFRKDGELSQSQAKRTQITENCQRVDLTPIEQAEAFKELMELDKLSQAQVAEVLGLSKSRVTKRLALLELPDELQARVKSGDTSGAVAYEISAKIKDPKRQLAVAKEVEDRGLNREEAVSFVAGKSAKKKSPTAKGEGEKPARKRSVSKKYKLPSQASVTILYPKSRMTKAQELEVAEEFVKYLKGELSEAEKAPKKTGKEAAVKD